MYTEDALPTLAETYEKRQQARKARRRIWKKRSHILFLSLCLFLSLHFQAGSPLLSLFRPTADLSHGWNLILVNGDSRLPENYAVELVELANGQAVDCRIYPALQEMFDTMRAEGVYPIVASGYRTAEKQQALLDEKIQEYRNSGHSRREAKQLALQWVAAPGTSEHQLGIAVDINQEGTRSTASQVYRWLAENAHRYGFIRRYPPDKTEITGVSSEPWHYRYVGSEAAAVIYEQDLTLEEYLALTFGP